VSESTRSSDSEARADAFALLELFAKYKRPMVGIPMVVAVLAVILVLLWPKSYLGVARVVPLQQSQSIALALLSQVGGGALAGAAGSALGMRSLADLYVGMLKSDTVSDAIIKRFGLVELYEEDTLVDTRKKLDERTTISSGRDGIIVIEVEDRSPERAAQLANAYVEELERISQNFAVTEAGLRRTFFEKQLLKAKDQLAEAEIRFKTSQEKTGLLRLEDQGRAIIEAIAGLRAQVAVKEVQLGSMRSYATDANAEYQRARRELAELRSQLEKLEKAENSKGPDIFIPTGKVPEIGLEYVRRLRDVKYYEVLFELLAKQYEVARLDEAKDAVVIQTLDKATPPDKKHKPKRALIVLGLTFLAVVFTTIGVFVREALERINADPVRGARLTQIRQQLFGGFRTRR